MKVRKLLLALLVVIIAFGSYFIYSYTKPKPVLTKNPINLAQKPKLLYTLGDGIKNVSLKNPMGLVTDDDGNVFITDTGNAQIKVLKSDGRLEYSFGSKGANQGQFNYPYGITILTNGNLLVADSANSTLQEVTNKGQFVRFILNRKDNIKPGSITKGYDGFIYVSDLQDNQIIVLNDSGQLIRKLKGNQPFNYPQGVAVNNDLLWVADSGNNVIKVTDKSGIVKKIIYGNEDKKSTKFSMVRGVAIDNLGRMYVSDTLANQIRVFNKDGKPLFTLISEDFAYPMGLYIDKDGKIYIMNRESGQIQVWGYK